MPLYEELLRHYRSLVHPALQGSTGAGGGCVEWEGGFRDRADRGRIA